MRVSHKLFCSQCQRLAWYDPRQYPDKRYWEAEYECRSCAHVINAPEIEDYEEAT